MLLRRPIFCGSFQVWRFAANRSVIVFVFFEILEILVEFGVTIAPANVLILN